jgi:hypothetical protein
MRKEPKSVANTPGVERVERLEGSRFVARQLYGLVAGGSRERLEVRQFHGPNDPTQCFAQRVYFEGGLPKS